MGCGLQRDGLSSPRRFLDGQHDGQHGAGVVAGDFGRQAVADAADEMGLDSLARFRGDDRFLTVTQPFADGAVFADDGDPGAAHQTNGTVAEPRYPAVVDGAEPFGKGEQRVYVLVGPDTRAYTVDATEDTSLAILFFLFKLLRNYACFGGGLDVSGK